MRIDTTHHRRPKDKKIFSYFENAKSTLKTNDIYLTEYLNLLSDPAKEKPISTLRALPSDQYKKRKVHQPCVTGSCIMDSKGRSKSNIERLNGFAVVDIDTLPSVYKNWDEVKQVLSKDDYTFLLHYSLSGKGLCIFVKIEVLPDFKVIYLSLQQYYFKEYAIEIDFLADETRLRFISYDPDYFLNENSKRYTDFLEVEAAPKAAAIGEIASFENFTTDPATVFNRSGLVGLETVNELLEQNGYTITKGSEPAIYEYLRPGGKSDKSFVSMFNEDVVKFHFFSPNTGLQKMEYNLYDLYKELSGFDDYEAQKQLSKDNFGIFHEPTAKVVKGQKESYTAVLEFLKGKDIKLNTLTGVIEFNGQPLTDFYISEMLLESSLLHNRNTSKDILLSVIDVLANGNQFHPFLVFIEKLKAVEPTNFKAPDELDKFIECFSSSTSKKLLRIYFKRWLLGLFDLHILQTMTKNVLFLTGSQNSCKTSLSKNILPIELKNYGKVVEFNSNKMTDSKIALCSVLVACFDEAESVFSKAKSLSDFKNLTASYDVFERRPYRRNHEQMFRASLILATSNHKDILTDGTGNTRFLTLDVQAFDLQKYFKINLYKLWRVIYDYHLTGQNSNLTDPERILQSKQNLDFEAIDPYTEMIEKNFVAADNGFVTTTDIMQQLERETRQQLSINRIGQALKKLGFERFAKKINGISKRGYKLKYCFEVD